MEQRPDVFRREGEPMRGRLKQSHHIVMAHPDPLGLAGRAGSEEHVGQGLRCEFLRELDGGAVRRRMREPVCIADLGAVRERGLLVGADADLELGFLRHQH